MDIVEHCGSVQYSIGAVLLEIQRGKANGQGILLRACAAPAASVPWWVPGCLPVC